MRSRGNLLARFSLTKSVSRSQTAADTSSVLKEEEDMEQRLCTCRFEESEVDRVWKVDFVDLHDLRWKKC